MTTSTRVDRRTFLARAGICGAGWAASLTGCGLRKAGLPARTFMLKGAQASGSGSREGAGAGKGVLLVRPFKVAAAFDSRAFVVRRSESEYVTDAYHAFLVPPGSMFTDLVAAWVRSLGVFGTVTTGGSQLSPTHALEGEVTECYADYRDARAPKAVLAGEFRLLHPLTGGMSPVAWRCGGRGDAVLAQAGPEALVAGWEEGFGAWCRVLEEMFRRPAPVAGGSNA